MVFKLEVPKMLFRVWDLGFRVWGLGCRVWALGFRVWSLGCGFRIQPSTPDKTDPPQSPKAPKKDVHKHVGGPRKVCTLTGPTS